MHEISAQLRSQDPCRHLRSRCRCLGGGSSGCHRDRCFASDGPGFINPALCKLAAEHAKGLVPVTSGNNSVPIGGGRTVQGYYARNGVPELASQG